MIQFDLCIIPVGWFNHQLVKSQVHPNHICVRSMLTILTSFAPFSFKVNVGKYAIVWGGIFVGGKQLHGQGHIDLHEGW